MPWPAIEYIRALDQNEWMRDFAKKWILNQDLGESDKALSDEVMNMEINLHLSNADTQLAVTVGLALLLPDKRHTPLLAAGKVEEFLAYYGDEYIGVIEEIAQREPKFHYLLGGVWKNRMSESVWRKVQAIRGPVW